MQQPAILDAGVKMMSGFNPSQGFGKEVRACHPNVRRLEGQQVVQTVSRHGWRAFEGERVLWLKDVDFQLPLRPRSLQQRDRISGEDGRPGPEGHSRELLQMFKCGMRLNV